ncbi:MAG: hypothetical protein RJQ10_06205, partial [Haliea sp.]|uniref:hypothetical protein n=1 Tax=Haliea sp. TaxID=1932666 RepID=UPI0032EFB07C
MSTLSPHPCGSPYNLSKEQITAFRRDGFIKLKNVFTPEELAYWRPIFGEVMRVKRRDLPYADINIKERDLYNQA